MTARQAAEFAGCSISTLKRYKCAWCDQNALDMLRYGCSAIWEPCNPKTDKTWPPKARKLNGSPFDIPARVP